MQVVTLNQTNFEAAALRLADKIRDYHPNRFSAVVAIRRGGAVVCDAMTKLNFDDYFGQRYDITLQRPSTCRKNGRIASILPKLPRLLLDGMRMAESIVLSLRHRFFPPTDIPDVVFDDDFVDFLLNCDAPEVLIIDDAVDSGITLLATVSAIYRLCSSAKVTTAVFTVTTAKPEINPDVKLYDAHTLIRFPWSNDFSQ